MFAGSHQGAQRAAMMYAFLGTCKALEVNPWAWLKGVFQRIPEHPVNRIHELLPNHWNTTNQTIKVKLLRRLQIFKDSFNLEFSTNGEAFNSSC